MELIKIALNEFICQLKKTDEGYTVTVYDDTLKLYSAAFTSYEDARAFLDKVLIDAKELVVD